MITIIHPSGEALDLFPSQSATLEFNSPLFSMDNQAGSYSYPMDLPATDKNKRLLNFPHRATSTRKTIDIEGDFAVYFGGRQFAVSKLKLIYPLTDKKYRGFLILNGFNDAVKDKAINQYSLGGTRNLGAQTLGGFKAHWDAVIASNGVDDFDYNFPLLKVSNFDFITNDDGVMLLNDIVTNYVPSVAKTAIPAPYVKYLISQIFNAEGYEFSPGWLDTPFGKKLLLSSRYFKAYPWVNFTSSPSDAYDNTLNLPDYLPSMPVADFINGLRIAFCMPFFFDTAQKKVTPIQANDILTSTDEDDWTYFQTAGIEIADGPATGGFRLAYELDNNDIVHSAWLAYAFQFFVRNFGTGITAFTPLLPYKGFVSDTMANFQSGHQLNDLYLATENGTIWQCIYAPGTDPAVNTDKGFTEHTSGEWYIPADDFINNYAGEYPAGFYQWQQLQPIRKADVDTVSDLPASGNAIGDVRLVNAEGYYAIWWNWQTGASTVTDWAIMAYHDATAYTEGAQQRQYTSKLQSLPMAHYTYLTQGFRSPITSVALEDAASVDRSTDAPLWLLADMGQIDNGLGLFYRYASSDAAASDNTPAGSSDCATLLNGPQGTVNVWWSAFLDFLKDARLVKTQVRLSPDQLANIKLERWKRFGSSKMLISKISGTIANNKQSITCTVEGYMI